MVPFRSVVATFVCICGFALLLHFGKPKEESLYASTSIFKTNDHRNGTLRLGVLTLLQDQQGHDGKNHTSRKIPIQP